MGLLGIDGPKFKMRSAIFGIGDDYWIEDGDGKKTFKVDGKKLRMRKTMVIENRNGQELFTVKERKLSVRDKMKIERDGDTVATVKKGLIGFRDKIVWEIDGADYKAKGDFFGQEFDIERDGKKVARVSKKFFSIRDAYGIQVADSENPALIIAAVVCIEQLVGLDGGE